MLHTSDASAIVDYLVFAKKYLSQCEERYGIDAKLFEWSDEITADCPRKQARNLYDQCGARCPDLPKVV